MFDEALVGTWVDSDDNASAVIQRGEWRSYRITFRDATVSEELTGYLTRFGAETFLDVTAERGEDRGPFLVPVHGCYRIHITGDTLMLAALDYDWFERSARARRLPGLTYTIDEKKNVLLTSPTKTLRAWVASHLKSEDAFSEPVTFTRQSK